MRSRLGALLEQAHRQVIPESKKGNFTVERLEKESDRYIDEIAPTLGSAEQRKEAEERIQKQKEENKNSVENEKSTTEEEENQ